MFKNTIKLLVSNFSTVWKLLLYKIIVIAITVGLFCASLSSLNNISSFQSALGSVSDFFLTFNLASAPETILNNLLDVFSAFFTFAGELFVQAPAIFAYLALVIFFIFPYLWHLSDLAVNERLFGFMSSTTKYSFTGSLIRNLNKENAYSWSFCIVILPFNLCFLAAVYGLIKLSLLGNVWLYLMPTIIVIIAIIYFSLRTTFFSSWSSIISATNKKTWPAFGRAISIAFRNFLVIWSNAIVFTSIFAFLCILTSAIGCAILLPLFSFVISILGMVILFENQGMRYYVDFNNIITPKKLEQTDKIKKLKNII